MPNHSTHFCMTQEASKNNAFDIIRAFNSGFPVTIKSEMMMMNNMTVTVMTNPINFNAALQFHIKYFL